MHSFVVSASWRDAGARAELRIRTSLRGGLSRRRCSRSDPLVQKQPLTKYAAIAQRDTEFWHWAALEMEGVDLLDLSIAYNSAGDQVNAYKTPVRSPTALREVRFHSPLYVLRDLATEPLRRVNYLINLYESAASPVPA